MRKYKFNTLLMLIAFFAFLSCKKEGYKATSSNTVNMAGRWWIQYLYDADQDGIYSEADGDEVVYSYEEIGALGLVTSNTAANTSDSLWVIDTHEVSPLKIKVPINYVDLTFKPGTVPNLSIEDETVRIISGKILKGAAHTKSGAVADSIFIEFELSNEEDNYYIFAGHRDTGQPEDQY